MMRWCFGGRSGPGFPLRGVVVVVAAALLASSAAEAGKKKPSPDVVEDALAYAQTDRARAIDILEAAINQAPNGKDVDLLMVNAGEQRRLAGNVPDAVGWFEKVVKHTTVGPDFDAARLGLSLITAGKGVDAKVLAVLQSVGEKDVPATQNADRYLLLALEAARASDPKGVSANGKKALSYAREDPAVLARVQGTVAALAKAPAGGHDVPSPLETGSPLERAETLYAQGDLEGARREAEKALKEAMGPEIARAQGLIQVIDSGPVDRNKIAVLLPLSDKYASVGKQIREAIEFGYGAGGRQLEFVDTGGTAATAVTALETAVLTKHAVAVVGPLLTDETDLVIARAEELHVPLVSLSQAYEETTGHNWALQAMYTRGDQVDALLDYVMTQRQMKSFAVFSPDSAVGAKSVELFKAGVAARGGRIATEATYSAEEQNLLPFARNLGVREGDIAALRAKAKAQGGNPDTVVLPPRLDFDGIFLPENARRTPLACAALAFEEFPMGDFQPTRDSPKIPLLGLSSWNDTGLVPAGNEYTRNSIFPDVFSATVVGDADPFVTAYKAATERTPSALEAATVDAGKLVAAAAKSSASTRAGFRDALLAAKVSDSVTGATGFDPNTLKARRTMLILSITKTTIDDLGKVTQPSTGAPPAP